MRLWKFLHGTIPILITALVILCGCDRQNNPTENQTKAGDFQETLEQALEKLKLAETEEEVRVILDQYPQAVQEAILVQCKEAEPTDTQEPWTGSAVDAALAQYGITQDQILAVQHMEILKHGVPIESVDAVITSHAWYYYHPVEDTISTEVPESMATATEMDIYGTALYDVAKTFWCWKKEWIVVFFLPVCFYELTIGQFDGILDAWAPNPPCDQCNGGICAAYLCGSAWDGSGANGWYNFHTCANIDYRASKKVGKYVQKRWVYSWRNCGKSDSDIAQSVRAHISF